VTQDRLRAEHPSWTWAAERNGMGWEYRGVRGEERVRVYACSQLVDEFENCRTVWYVDDGTKAENYLSWNPEQRG